MYANDPSCYFEANMVLLVVFLLPLPKDITSIGNSRLRGMAPNMGFDLIPSVTYPLGFILVSFYHLLAFVTRA